MQLLRQMSERRELIEKHGVIFVLWDGKTIQLERRSETTDKFFGFTIIPGGVLKLEKL